MSLSTYLRSSFGRSAAPGGGPWTPADMDGLLVWLDAARQASILTTEDTAQPTTLTDYSGNGRHASLISDVVDSPLTLQHDGDRWVFHLTADTYHRYSLPSGSVPLGDAAYSIIAVCSTSKGLSTDVGTLVYSGGPAEGGGVALNHVILKQNTNLRLNTAWHSSNLFSSNGAITANTLHLLETYYDQAGRQQYVDEVDAGSDTSTERSGREGPVYLFGEANNSPTTRWAGDVCALLVFDRALTDDERSQLNEWLAARYAIPALTPLVTFGFVTDLHNADLNPSLGRYYRDAPKKLAAAVATFNAEGVDFVHMNGDYIDGVGTSTADALADLAEIEAVFATANAPRTYAVGNHDLHTLTRAEWLANSGMDEFYYSFDVGGVHFVVLDACYNSDSDDDPYDAGYNSYATAYVPPAERAWLEADLAANELPVIVFCHHRLDGDGTSDNYVANNAATIRGILETDGNTVAVITGHAHENLQTDVNGIHYIGIEALTDGAYPTNAYAVVKVMPDLTVIVEGYGNQTDYEL